MTRYLLALILALVCLPMTSLGQSQSIFVTLERDDLSIPEKRDLTLIPHTWIDFDKVIDISDFKIPSTIKDFVICFHSANYVQKNLTPWVKSGENKADLEKTRERSWLGIPLDTIDIQKIYIYAGIDQSKGEKYIVVDKNNNNDFTDDKLYVYPLDGYKTDPNLCDIIEVDLPYYTGRGYITIKVRIGIFPYRNSNRYFSEPSLNIGFSSYRNNLLGELVLDNKRIRISVSGNEHMVTTRILNNDWICIVPDVTQNTFKHNKIGDTVQLGDRMILLKSAEGTRLEMVDLGPLPDSSSVGRYLPALYAYDVDDSHTVLVNDMIKGKYTFIDLWGSWCGPCIKSLPKMVEMYGKVRGQNDVALIGLGAERDQAGVAALKQAISENNVSWPNYWFHKSAEKFQGTPAEKLKIASYPSYIIVDKSGKIVFTTNDPSCKREDAISFFMDLIK